MVGVVMWPRFVSWALSLHGHSGRHVAVAFVAWPQWVSSRCIVSWALSLRGHSGCRVMWLRWVLRRVAAVGVIMLCFVLQAP